jgi:UDP-N-acetylmuramoyl-tripeptide--D-alanyl-D-alanine ligase
MLGGIENVYKEKKNLADYLDRCGKPLVLNIDDEWLVKIKDDYKSELITVGKNSEAMFRFQNVDVSPEGTKFELMFEDETYSVHVNVFGEDLAYNAVSAIAAAYRLGIPVEDAVNAISAFQPNNGRFEATELRRNVIMVNDAYNANPTSMRMSLKTFDRLYPSSLYHRIVILGDMKELGDVSESMHIQLGEFVKGFNFEQVFYIGNYFSQFNTGEEIDSPDEMAAGLVDILDEKKGQKVAILLKGSHGIGLYNIPDYLSKLGFN